MFVKKRLMSKQTFQIYTKYKIRFLSAGYILHDFLSCLYNVTKECRLWELDPLSGKTHNLPNNKFENRISIKQKLIIFPSLNMCEKWDMRCDPDPKMKDNVQFSSILPWPKWYIRSKSLNTMIIRELEVILTGQTPNFLIIHFYCHPNAKKR